ncbi:MAG: glycerol-1-phosphate dehydrogenase, partial [Archaeoglobaceae archaeon]
NGTHGEQVGIGTIIFEYMYEKNYGDGNWIAVKNALKKAGAPVRVQEIGISKEQAIEALLYAKKIRRKRFTILEALNPTRDDFEQILQVTGIV